MMKNDVITECVALPIMVQNFRIGSKTTTMTTIRMKSILEKYMFVSHTKHTQRKINESTSFAIDNMYNVNFRI